MNITTLLVVVFFYSSAKCFMFGSEKKMDIGLKMYTHAHIHTHKQTSG